MSIEWEIRFGTPIYHDCMVDGIHLARVRQTSRGWIATYNPVIHRLIPNVARTHCKTPNGIKRRVQKYVAIWVMAGRPT